MGSTNRHDRPMVGQVAAEWLLARVREGSGEAVFCIDADERFWRVRREVGRTASMFEASLARQSTAHDVAAALVSWAHSAGLDAQVRADPGEPVQVSVGRTPEQDLT